MQEDKIKSLEKQIELDIANGKRLRAFFLSLKALWIKRVELFSFINKELEEGVKDGES